jgi:hypothetical protein
MSTISVSGKVRSPPISHMRENERSGPSELSVIAVVTDVVEGFLPFPERCHLCHGVGTGNWGVLHALSPNENGLGDDTS